MYKALNIPVYLMIWLLDACIVIKLCAVAALRFEMNKGQRSRSKLLVYNPVEPVTICNYTPRNELRRV